MANKYRRTSPNTWHETGCGCGGSKPITTTPAVPGVSDALLLVWTMPIPSVVVASIDNSKYQTQGSMILLDLTSVAYAQFVADPRFRVPSEAEKSSMFGYKGRIL